MKNVLLSLSAWALVTTMAATPAKAADPPPCVIGKLPNAGSACLIANPNEARDLYEAVNGTSNGWSQAVQLTGTRFQVTKVDRKLRVICLRDKEDDQACVLKIEEKLREITFLQDLKKVVKAVTGIGSGGAVGGGTVVEVMEKCLVLTRATVTVEASEAGKEEPGETCEGGESGRSHDVVIDRRANHLGPEKLTLLTGPIEHFFLGAQLPLKKFNELKYDSSTHTVVEKEKPSSFLVGLNYSLGDVLTEKQTLRERIFFSAMLAPSNKPLKQYGIGAGLRLWKFSSWADLSGVTVFVARVWTEGDEVAGTDGATVRSKRKTQTQFGIGFNASKALEWLKKSSE